MDLDVQLDAAQLADASKHVQSRIPDVVKVMTDMASTLQHNDKALVGGAAVEMVEALNAWGKSAAKLPTVLAEYALTLGQVGASMQATDVVNAVSLQAAGAKLASSSSLNLH